MASTPITRAFDNHAEAETARSALLSGGIPDSAISILARAPDEADAGVDASDAVATGATVGTLVGGGLGTLAGLGAMAIPGVGPIVAAGWLVAALTGAGVGAASGAGVAAAAGGLYGTLHQTGLSDEHAQFYAESVKRGGSLVLVRSEDATMRGMAEDILGRSGHVDVETRSQAWRDSGWRGHDASNMSVDTSRRYGS